MLLTVDVGNSHTVSGVYRGDQLLAHWRLKSDRDRTADELAIRYHSLFQMAGISGGRITGFILSSVVPTLETAWLNYADKYLRGRLQGRPLSVSHRADTGIIVKIKNPAEVGADRIVNSVAAYEMYHDNLIVIDFGTAITFDCVTDRREYIGGTIHPGIGISLDALASRTAKLPRVDIDTGPETIIGKTTVTAIHSGILYGFGGLVDRMVDILGRELAPDQKQVKTVATGGMAHLIEPFTRTIDAIDPLLTLEGLRLIHARNLSA
ncbi:MAG TPA: type III pantothenate kinase [Desulfobulbaceae bacterium]|nr:type III pantothenate kinase [Desulfobulbaceae bacterium]